MFLFFPVLRRGSLDWNSTTKQQRFYSSPSCDGDPPQVLQTGLILFLFFPVLRRGSKILCLRSTTQGFYSSPSCDGDLSIHYLFADHMFLFFPVLRRGSVILTLILPIAVSILPRLATGIRVVEIFHLFISFYSSPSCDGDRNTDKNLSQFQVSILPRLATGIREP